MLDHRALALQRARVSISTERLAQIHAPIEAAIRAVREYLSDIPPDDEFGHIVADNQLPYLEDLLGVAFVAAQSQLTAVRTAMLEVSEVALRVSGKPLPFLGGGKGYDLFHAFNPTESKSGQSRLQVINAIANYWKHHEQWPTTTVKRSDGITIEWDLGAAGQARPTIDIVSALGMSPHGNQNIHEALHALGISDPADLSELRSWIESWSRMVLEEAQNVF